jgi:hypothetical protein
MQKFRLFFEKINLLKNAQFDELIKCVTLDIELPNKTHDDIYLNITYLSTIPIEIFTNLYLNSLNFKNNLKIVFKNTIACIELEDFINYLKF